MLFTASHRSSPPARVVITGAGTVTSLGIGWEKNSEGFRLGRIALNPVQLFDVSRQRVKIAGEVDLPAELPATRLNARQEKRLDRAARLLLLAANEAWCQAGWDAEGDLPVVLGTTSGGMALGEAYYRHAISNSGTFREQPTRVLQYQPQQQALALSEAFGFKGSMLIIANACASGGNAIGHAWEMLRARKCERVLAGGYDALCQLVFAGFDSLHALSPTECRPFDSGRDGLALGEGAAILTLETLEHAEKRGANILGEIAGYGASLDTHHLTQPHPQGDAAVISMTEALERAGIDAGDVGYVNAHGTGTPMNDSAEANAISRWAGTRASTLPVSSTKASVGHLLGAAGAVEAVICLMALRGQWLPPTTTLRVADEACSFPLVQKPATASLDYAMSNSFGFGGANATLILRRWS